MNRLYNRALFRPDMTGNMGSRHIRQCLNCGLEAEPGFSDFREPGDGCHCAKCDENLFTQTDGSTITRDIAHHGETLTRAESKMEAVLQQAWQGYARAVRLIVGGGRIRTDILGQLEYYQAQGCIRHFSVESPNHGAILVVLR